MLHNVYGRAIRFENDLVVRQSHREFSAPHDIPYCFVNGSPVDATKLPGFIEIVDDDGTALPAFPTNKLPHRPVPKPLPWSEYHLGVTRKEIARLKQRIVDDTAKIAELETKLADLEMESFSTEHSATSPE